MQSTNGTGPNFRHTPLFEQVQDWIAARIESGELKGKIPTENELARSLKVSCGTMRKAMAGLSSRGIIERVQGHGTFVRERVDIAKLPEPARALIELLGRLPEATRNEVALAIQARLHELANGNGAAS